MDKNATVKLLMVDDHPLILKGYKDVLDRRKPADTTLSTHTANSCKVAWQKLQAQSYDIVFLDINLPPSEDEKFISGEDLGESIRREYPHIKIIILTQLEETLHLTNILKNIQPEGFLLKGETNPDLLTTCLDKVLENRSFYSPKIFKLQQKNKSHHFKIDDYDRKLLYYLSIGTKTKDLHRYIPLSTRAIEDRKRRLKDYFDASNNQALLKKAKAEGYI